MAESAKDLEGIIKGLKGYQQPPEFGFNHPTLHNPRSTFDYIGVPDESDSMGTESVMKKWQSNKTKK